MRILFMIFFFVGFSLLAFGQKTKKKKAKYSAEFGFQVKPIVPINYFGAGEQNFSDSIVNITLSPLGGVSFGAIIRQKITPLIAIETGIAQVKRTYKMSGESSAYNSSDQGDFAFVNYQIPIQGLIYIRLSEQLFMNTTAGIGLDMYPSSVTSKGEKFILHQLTFRQHWINTSLLANIGLEYRTESKGTFYLGASLNRPFSPIGETVFRYYYSGNNSTRISSLISGNYLTIDLRFFFAENTDK